jgi:hypothetical protein
MEGKGTATNRDKRQNAKQENRKISNQETKSRSEKNARAPFEISLFSGFAFCRLTRLKRGGDSKLPPHFSAVLDFYHPYRFTYSRKN